MKTKNKINPSEVLNHLVKANGKIEWASRYKPLDELIFTVLTQHTSDINAEKAFEKLKKEIPIWEDVLKTPTKKIASLILDQANILDGNILSNPTNYLETLTELFIN